jgi:hypothetical protein
VVIAVDSGGDPAVARFYIFPVAILENRQHLVFGVAARTGQRHVHGDVDGIGLQHDIARRVGESSEQLLAGGIVSIGQCRSLRADLGSRIKR